MASAPAAVRCRAIVPDDLPTLVALLDRGFPGRGAAWWQRGLTRMAARSLPPDTVRFGFVLESGSQLVGAILLIYATTAAGDERCNLSSWYVEPAFRLYAGQLVAVATRRSGPTYINVSPARHTWAAIEVQGFQRFSEGLMIFAPMLQRREAATRVHVIAAGDTQIDLPESDLLRAHAAYGCAAYVVEAADGKHPFVLQLSRARSGRVRLPAAHLLFCRDAADFMRFAGTLARPLLALGAPLVMLDAIGPIPDLRGIYAAGRRPKYFRGPIRPRLGDLAWSELALFGA